MRKILFILLIFIFSVNFVFAQQNVSEYEKITVTGKVTLVSIDDSWIVVKLENTLLSKMWNSLKTIFGRRSENTNIYRVNVVDRTILESSEGESVTLDNILVGDSATVTGFLIEKIDKDKSGLIEADYVKIYHPKSVTTIITEFFGFNRTKSLDNNDGNKINMSNLNKLPSFTDAWIEDLEDCVGEGEPILEPTLFAPKVNKECCEGLKPCLIDGYSTVTISNFQYVLKGYCRKECLDSDYQQNNFEKTISLEDSMKYILPQIPEKPIRYTKNCVRDADCLSYEKCVNGKCVNNNDVVVNTKYCVKNEDCIFNGSECVSKGTSSFVFFLSGQLNSCACVNNICQYVPVTNKDTKPNSEIECGDEVFEVCGEDNKTYRNPCEAFKAGVKIQCNKPCPCNEDEKPIDVTKCDVNTDCVWCNDNCYTENMIKLTKMQCDEKIPDGVSCVCDEEEKTCKLEEKEDNLPPIAPIFDPIEPEIPDHTCSKDTECAFCGSECVTKSVLNKILDTGGSCDSSLQPNNMKCVCKNSVCVTERIQKPTDSTIYLPKEEDNLPEDDLPEDNNGVFENISINGFCGQQTNGACVKDSDCTVGGCSGIVCQSKSEPSVITTCDWKGCYQKPGNVYCGCNAGKCQWYSAKNTIETVITENPNTPVIVPPTTVPTAPLIIY